MFVLRNHFSYGMESCRRTSRKQGLPGHLVMTAADADADLDIRMCIATTQSIIIAASSAFCMLLI
eukprot:m.545154 g.545154  ORF g.545154 m.545154 type:complete len:65 (-) comp22142_c0_seq39:364-558(-)